MTRKILKFAITGGPCSGKTTSLTYICEKLRNYGFQVVVVPEAATLCINGGIGPIEKHVNSFNAQCSIIESTVRLEQIFEKAAKHMTGSIKPVIMICDRGVVDCKAYMTEENYIMALKLLDLNPTQARDSYDGVFHLSTAADGAAEFYTLENNKARYESPKEALITDERTKRAWIGHEHLRVIDNSTDFKTKIRRLLQHICEAIGIPVPIEDERKFLVERPKIIPPVHHETVEITQFYCMSQNPDEEIRMRKRGQNGEFSYYETLKKKNPNGKGRFETQNKIDEREFNIARRFRDPNKKEIVKRRTCFLFNNQYFELDDFEGVGLPDYAGGLLLEIELTKDQMEVEIPPFLEVIKEVTDDERFYNASLAKI